MGFIVTFYKKKLLACKTYLLIRPYTCKLQDSGFPAQFCKIFLCSLSQALYFIFGRSGSVLQAERNLCCDLLNLLIKKIQAMCPSLKPCASNKRNRNSEQETWIKGTDLVGTLIKVFI